MLKLGRCFPQP